MQGKSLAGNIFLGDESGVEVATSGDWPAWLQKHGGWLRKVVMSRVGSVDATEEVLQEVSLAAVRSEAGSIENVTGWLYRVAVRAALIYRRRAGRQRKLVNGFAVSGKVDAICAEPDPLSWLLLKERRERVREALQQTPPADREILLLKYTENWDCAEIARRLGVSVPAVEARLLRARRRLKAILIRDAKKQEEER